MRPAFSSLVIVTLVGTCLTARAARLGLVAHAETQADTTFIGDQEGDLFGMSQAIGDLDGDGIDDLLLGTLDDFRSTRLEIFHGPLQPGLRDVRTQPADTEIVGSAFLGGRMGVDFNLLLADMNGDGRLDIVVGATLQGGVGTVDVIFGPLAPGIVALDALPRFHVVGGDRDTFFGLAVEVGDLSGDGIPDLVAGEPFGGCCGRAHVFFGPLAPGNLDLAVMPASYTLQGTSPGGLLGHGLAVADVSGDGKPDLLVGEPGSNGALGDRLWSGAIHVLGGPVPPAGLRVIIRGARGGVPPDGEGGDGIGAIIRTGDLDADGSRDIVTTGFRHHAGGREVEGMVSIVYGPFLDPSIDLLTTPNQANIFAARQDDRVGYDILVADVGADGLADLVFGADQTSAPCTDGDPGVGHVLRAPIEQGLIVDLATDVSDLAITSSEPLARCGIARAAADLDGDGMNELVFGCNLADRPDGSGINAGIVYVLSPESLEAQGSGPCCDAGAPIAVPCDAPRSPCGVEVQLDGSASSDPLGGILTFAWEVQCGAAIVSAVGPTPLVCLDAAPGTTCAVTLTARSPEGLAASCSTSVAFDASDPPELLGVPAADVAACDEVPPAPIVNAVIDCAPAIAPLAERRSAGACEDTYTLVRTWTVTDAAGNVAQDEKEIAESDTTATVHMGVPAAIVVGCGALPAPAPVEARDACDPAPVLGMSETEVPGDCGQSVLRTWTARDRCGNEASASQSIEVRDEEPPVVAEGDAELAALWSPNHRMACLDASSLAPSIGEACSQPVSWRIVACSSDQPDDGRGDGATPDDCVVAPDGQSACVRAERAGGRQAGRRYALSIVATDGCGNASDATVIGYVRVPHDQRRRR